MSKFDRDPRLTIRNLAILGLLTFGLISCTPQVTSPPLVEATAPMQSTPVQSIVIENTLPPPVEPSPTQNPVYILTNPPLEWETGEDNATIQKKMSDMIVQIINAEGDQYTKASETLPPEYMNAVVNITYDTDHPWGGTGTFIGVNTQTNESIFLTASHVLLEDNTQFHIKNPNTGLDTITSLDNITVARSPEGYFNDMAVVKLPFIPTGIQAFPVTGTDLCTSQQPQVGMAVNAFAFPYINGGPGFVEFFSRGGVETISGPDAISTTCYAESATGSLFIPTTMPTRPGTSGALVLDGYNQAIGIMKAMSPHGAVVMPLDTLTLTSLIQQTGFTPQP